MSTVTPCGEKLRDLRNALGLTQLELALRAGVSERTVKAHMTAIFKSLRVSGRADAIAMARRCVLL